MSHPRWLRYSSGIAALALLGAALWLPVDFGHAAPKPTDPPGDLAVVRGDVVGVVTLRVGDLTEDPLYGSLLELAGPRPRDRRRVLVAGGHAARRPLGVR